MTVGPLPDADRPDLAAIAVEITDRVHRALPGYLEARAYARLDPGTGRRRALPAVVAAAIDAGSTRTAVELRALFDLPLDLQRRTPLEIVRGSGRELTVALQDLGTEPEPRDPFHVRAWPDDHFALVPDGVADLGDPGLPPLLFAWGAVKAARRRAEAEHDVRVPETRRR